MKSVGLLAALVLNAVAPLCAGAADTEPIYSRLKLGIGYHYSSGKYGSADTTEITYIPLTFKAELGRWTLQGTLPHLHISGPPGVIQGPNGPIQTTSGEADGVGDVITRGWYTLLPLKRWMPFIDLIGVVKFPTASRGKGLGTGKFDFGLETELSWSYGKLSPFVLVGYRFLGSPPDTPLHDVVLAAAGGSYRIWEPLNAGLLVDYRGSAAAGLGDRLEIVPYATWTFTTHWSADIYASAGLASGSPDAGTGVQLGYTW